MTWRSPSVPGVCPDASRTPSGSVTGSHPDTHVALLGRFLPAKLAGVLRCAGFFISPLGCAHRLCRAPRESRGWRFLPAIPGCQYECGGHERRSVVTSAEVPPHGLCWRDGHQFPFRLGGMAASGVDRYAVLSTGSGFATPPTRGAGQSGRQDAGFCADPLHRPSRHARPRRLNHPRSNSADSLESDGRLRAEEWEVANVPRDIAERIIAEHHYARGASNTRVYLHGLYPAGWHWHEECVGVAWWIPPTKSAALATYPDNWRGVLALSRLAIMPGIPKNAASFLLAGSRKLIDRNRWPVLVTYADDWRGHTGSIYRADNWTYCGLTKPEAVYTIDGRMVARKAGPKTRTHAEMIALGAVFEGRFAKHKFVHRLPLSNSAHRLPRQELRLGRDE